MKKRYSKVLPLVAFAAFLLGIFVYFWMPENRTSAPQVQIGGNFALTNHKGQPVTQEDFANKPMAIFFGYTFCPDVCPTTLSDMTGWVEALGEDADKLHYVFVSVDAERDDQETLASYVDAFFEQLVGLYGTQQQLDTVIKAYRIYAKKNTAEDTDSNYTIDHTASVYLMKKPDIFMNTILFNENHDVAVAKLRELIATAE